MHNNLGISEKILGSLLYRLIILLVLTIAVIAYNIPNKIFVYLILCAIYSILEVT